MTASGRFGDLASLINRNIERHLISTEGAEGMARFLERVRAHISPLVAAWDARDFAALGAAAMECAKTCDSEDLRAIDFKLRSAGQRDTLVWSKLFEALIEALAGGDERVIFEAVEAAAATEGAPDFIGFFGSPMRLLLIRLQLRRGLAAEAVATANKSLAVLSSCPHTQRYLYLALMQQRQAGERVEPRSVALQDISDRFCDQPFKTLATMGSTRFEKGTVPQLYACQCPAMLPYSVSDGTETQPIEDIWNGDAIQEMRRSILDGDFTYCSRFYCADILGGRLPKKNEVTNPKMRSVIENHRVVLDDGPRLLSLSHDPSCNLACPSCRKEIISIKNEQRDVLDRFSDRILLPLMEGARTTLVISGDGDPFSSKHYRRLIRNLDPVRHSKARVQFITNGLLLTEREWSELSNLHGMIGAVCVSVDAAEAEVYEDLRRPGKWSVITQNLEFLSQLRRADRVPYVSLNFVVQQKNYRQIPAFIEMTRAFGFDRALFLKLINIGSFTADEFVENDVCDPRHPEHQEFLATLHHPAVRWPEVHLFTLQPYLELSEMTA